MSSHYTHQIAKAYGLTFSWACCYRLCYLCRWRWELIAAVKDSWACLWSSLLFAHCHNIQGIAPPGHATCLKQLHMLTFRHQLLSKKVVIVSELVLSISDIWLWQIRLTCSLIHDQLFQRWNSISIKHGWNYIIEFIILVFISLRKFRFFRLFFLIFPLFC